MLKVTERTTKIAQLNRDVEFVLADGKLSIRLLAHATKQYDYPVAIPMTAPSAESLFTYIAGLVEEESEQVAPPLPPLKPVEDQKEKPSSHVWVDPGSDVISKWPDARQEVYSAVLKMYDREKDTGVSTQELATLLNISSSTIYGNLVWLRKRGYIVFEKDSPPGVMGVTYVYYPPNRRKNQ